MPLDTSIIRQATFQPIQFKAPDRVNMLLQAAQAAQAVQSLQAGQEERQARAEGQRRMGAVSDAIRQATAAAGGTQRLRMYGQALLESGLPQYVDAGIKLMQSADEQDAFEQAFGAATKIPGGGAPAEAAAMPPVTAPGAVATPVSANVGAPQLTSGANERGLSFPATREEADRRWAESQAGAPLPPAISPVTRLQPITQPVAAPVAGPANAMAPAAPAANQLADRPTPPNVSALLALGTPRAMQAADAIMEQYKLRNPKELAGPEIVQLMRARDALPLGSPDRALIDERIRRLNAPPAPAATLTVNTGKQFGEAFATKLAEKDSLKMDAAEKAGQMAESANRIIELAQRPDVFVGQIADIKLNIARMLNLAGANNDEAISNTERLIAATGQSTLDAIKGAGLGAGQGFTDKDLKFLQGVAGGTINLNQQTLIALAELQHRAASRAAEAWNKRVKEMPQDVIQGTGLSTTPITVPPLKSVRAAIPVAATGAAPAAARAPIFATNPQTGQRIMSLDGGNTWTAAPAR